jgi:hypothetical protein
MSSGNLNSGIGMPVFSRALYLVPRLTPIFPLKCRIVSDFITKIASTGNVDMNWPLDGQLIIQE